jgi:hypothetical protein
VTTGKFIIARDDQKLVAAISCDDDIAYGACYLRLGYIVSNLDDPSKRASVFRLMLQKVFEIVQKNGLRTVFIDLPEYASFVVLAGVMPGARKVGSIEGLHDEGVTSVVYRIDPPKASGAVTNTKLSADCSS